MRSGRGDALLVVSPRQANRALSRSADPDSRHRTKFLRELSGYASIARAVRMGKTGVASGGIQRELV